MNKSKEACHCKSITYGMLEAAIKAGYTNYEDLQEKLRFGTSCGKCQEFIRHLIKELSTKAQ